MYAVNARAFLPRWPAVLGRCVALFVAFRPSAAVVAGVSAALGRGGARSAVVAGSWPLRAVQRA